MEVSASLFERALRVIPGGVNSPVRAFKAVGGNPFFTQRAEGPFLHTADGRRLIDFVGTWGPAIHGHNRAELRDAIRAALERGTSFGTPHAGEVDMAEAILRFFPSIEKVRLCNSGTEATMSCIRLARGYTRRDKIIKFSGCYHGHVDSLLVSAGSGALTLGHPDSGGIPAAVARETLVLPFNDLAAVEETFRQWSGQIAGIILEPIPANVGLILPKPGYLEGLRRLCTQEGSLLIFDEVMTGFRLAPGGAQEILGITPDLTALGKIIGGGLPVGAFGGKASILDHLAPLGPVYQAGTLSGNPLAVAAGMAALRLLEANPPYQRLASSGCRLAEALRDACAQRGIPAQVPQIGSMLSLFFRAQPVHDYASALCSDAALFSRFFSRALELGVYLPPSAYETWFLSDAHDPSVVDEACDKLSQALLSL